MASLGYTHHIDRDNQAIVVKLDGKQFAVTDDLESAERLYPSRWKAQVLIKQVLDGNPYKPGSVVYDATGSPDPLRENGMQAHAKAEANGWL